MAVQVNGEKSFTATAAITAFRRVKLTAASGTAVEHAGAGEAAIGTAQQTVALGEKVTVRLDNAGGTHKCVAAASTVVGAAIYNAATGYVDDAVAGTAFGVGLEAAGATGDVIEVLINA